MPETCLDMPYIDTAWLLDFPAPEWVWDGVFFQIRQLCLCQKNCLMMLQYSLSYAELSAFFEAVLSLKHPGMNIGVLNVNVLPYGESLLMLKNFCP